MPDPWEDPEEITLLFPASYPSECPWCWHSIEVGELIAGSADGFVCEECYHEFIVK